MHVLCVWLTTSLDSRTGVWWCAVMCFYVCFLFGLLMFKLRRVECFEVCCGVLWCVMVCCSVCYVVLCGGFFVVFLVLVYFGVIVCCVLVYSSVL